MQSSVSVAGRFGEDLASLHLQHEPIYQGEARPRNPQGPPEAPRTPCGNWLVFWKYVNLDHQSRNFQTVSILN